MFHNIDTAYLQLQNALTVYDKKHKDTAGREGLKRRDKFVNLLNNLQNSKKIEDFENICVFYKKQKSSSRLIIEIRNSLIIIFGIKKPKLKPTEYAYYGRAGLYIKENSEKLVDIQISKAIQSLRKPQEMKPTLARKMVANE